MQQRTNATPGAEDHFPQWLDRRLRDLGYDLGARGGGRTKFAADAGISASSVSRLLAGRGKYEAALLAKIAPVLRVELSELMVRAGIVTADAIGRAADPQPDGPPMTPQEAAAQLGIQSDTAVALFVSMVRTMQEQEATRRQQEVRRMEP
ncbi:Cro/C1-type HTH DNA-binding domain-containing protein [Streptomyces sp. TLI_053]|uniref:helix-turn-helix domain-containing protein n=1 Tax=Streptomyces sp. TLI_053 TaxID=1855352 RepID=UPI00087BE8C1|nr:helix-turn-helix transcriptional regulator [Streptomyces sp. TLI_053]SDT69579.1 Cro/C1-type HTH DNA-binding domain-containing protein [Streptomyces sp. TLI_053]